MRPAPYRHIIHPRFVIAELLGANLEAYFKLFPGSGQAHEKDCWVPIHRMTCMNNDTLVRVQAGGESIMAQAEAFITSNFYVMEYIHGDRVYKYLVPNSARESKYVHIQFGFGVITDHDGKFIAKQYLLSQDRTGPDPEDHLLYLKLVNEGVCVHSQLLLDEASA